MADPMNMPSVRQIIRDPTTAKWWCLTLIIVFWSVVSGSGYVVLGDGSAGPVYYVVRTLGGVVVANAITLVLGCVIMAALRTRAAAIAVFLFGMWSVWMSFALFMGFVYTHSGWGGWVGWLAFAFLAFLQFVTAPKSMYLVPKGKDVVVTHIPARDIVHKRSPAHELRTRNGES